MSNPPGYVVNRTKRFVSHPTADLIKPLIIKTQIGNFIDFRSNIDWLFNDFEGDYDNSETHVVGRHIQKSLQCKNILLKI